MVYLNFISFLITNKLWLLAGFLLALSSSFGQTFFISIFAVEIMSSFNLSNSDWGTIYASGTLMSAAVMIYTGGLVDDYKTRNISFLVLGILALAMVSMAAVSSISGLIITIFLLRLMGQGMSTHLAQIAMSRWFSRYRGRALAIANLGYSLGESFITIFFVGFLLFLPWRSIWLFSAVLPVIVAVAIFFTLRSERSPNSFKEDKITLGLGMRHWSRSQVLKSSIFWLAVPGLLGLSAFGTVLFFQQVNYSNLKGWEHLSLVKTYPLFTLIAVGISFFSGWLIDKYGAIKMIGFYQIPAIFGFYMFSICETLLGFSIGLIFFAITAGSNNIIPNAFWAECFGTAHLGRIKSLAGGVMVIGSALGPLISGYLIDLNIDLNSQYLACCLYFIFSSFLLLLATRRGLISI